MTDGRFKDFLLSQMLEVRGTAETATYAAEDDKWHSEVTLEVSPHPDLPETQAKVIALDCGMLERLGLDTDTCGKKMQDQRIALMNHEVVDADY